MSDYPKHYDDSAQTLSLFFSFEKAETLVPVEVVKKWSQALREKTTPCGRELTDVFFVFKDKETAEYNHQALAFANIKARVGDLRYSEPLDTEEPSFGVREDFGIGEGGMNQIKDS